jgi:hypothetical protein
MWVFYASAFLLYVGAVTRPATADLVPLAVGALLGCHVLRFVWLYRAWSALPAVLLVNRDGTPITPGGAVGRHFIPFYSVYWTFAARSILCNALHEVVKRAGVVRRPPRALAILAGIIDLVPYANVLLGPLINLLFMTNVDKTFASLSRAQVP